MLEPELRERLARHLAMQAEYNDAMQKMLSELMDQLIALRDRVRDLEAQYAVKS